MVLPHGADLWWLLMKNAVNTPLRQPRLAGTLGLGMLSGALVGLVDGILGLGGASQFLGSFAGFPGFLGLTAGAYALTGGALTLGMYLFWTLLLARTGPARILKARWTEASGWHIVAGYGVAGLVAGFGYVLAVQRLGLWASAAFNHKGLIAVLVAVLALVLAAAAGVFTILVAEVLARLLKPLLSRLSRVPLLQGILALALPTLLLLAGLAAAAWWQWEVATNLPLKKIAFALALGLTSAFSLVLAIRWPGPRPRRFGLRLAIYLGPLVLMLVVQLLTMSQALRKAGDMNSALTGPILAGARKVADLDRDGHSAMFGGQDCNDLDPEVHPGAFDWPDDGIDQNCLGGDAKVQGREPNPYFPVPDGVPKRMNVVLITVDALVASHLGCYGYERNTSPRLDNWARSAVLFERSFAHAPSTRYSFPTIMTSRYPASVIWGDGSWPPPVVDQNLTWAEVMKEHGLFTGAILNYRFFKPEWGLNQGFDFYDNSRSRLHQGKSDPATHGISSDQMADAAIDFVEKHREDNFFLWVHFYDPHWFYEPHPDMKSFGKSKVDLYDGEVLFTDYHIGRLLEHLGQGGLEENTIVIVTGDHGEGFGEHGVWLHGYHLYNPQTFVPIIMKVPGIQARRVASEPVGHVDLLPTVDNLLGGTPKPEFQGASVLDLLQGRVERPRRLFQEVWFADKGPFTRIMTVVTNRYKLIYNEQPSGTFELYDLDEDFGETRDIWGAAPVEEEARLREMVVRHMEEDHLPTDFHERVAPNIREEPFEDCPDNVHVVFGNPPVVELVGASITPDRVGKGDSIRIVTWWKVVGRFSSGWKLFAHLKPRAGSFLNADHEPVGGYYGLKEWRPGQYIRDVHVMTMASRNKPGRYRLLTGFFQEQDRMDTTVVDGAEADDKGGAFVGEFTLER